MTDARAHGLPVWSQLPGCERGRVTAFVAIGDNAARCEVSARLRHDGVRLGTVVHPSALVMPSATLGTGVLVCPRAFVGVGTVVEDDAVLNTGCSIDHESVIGAGAYLAPGVTTAGQVRVGRGAFVGLGALLGPNVGIGDHAVVAAGGVVLDSVPDAAMVAGVPARIRRRLQLPLDYRRLLAGPSPVREVPHAG
jgi:UDP-perosamine 4-acetyltransferase